ncbi:MAG TPA: serine/threonine-protein kinase, partial [Bryobacteraceae bacterium]|nr:serine/threonine-protein kinase [Bryobacteraceae bacterium]
MDPAIWQRVQSALEDALAREPADRARFVSAIADDYVRSEVLSLLAVDTDDLDAQLASAISGTAGRLTDPDPKQAFPSLISHYRVLELIGAGGMSEVYLAEDMQLGRKVALKLLPRVFSSDPERIRRFEQEARAASALNHPNIVTIFEVDNTDGRWFIAMEYVPGEPLSSIVSRGPIPVPDLLNIGEQIAAAMSAAHEQGILHRDIKPANIMVRPDGLVKVVDFGVARLMPRPERETSESAMTLAGTVVGTPSYMAPEQARGMPLDYAADLWSLGAVLYEMAAGAPAFAGKSTADILVAVLERPAPRPSLRAPGLPRAVDEVVLTLLSKEPRDRFRSAAEVRNRLQQVRSGDHGVPIRSRAISWRTGRWRTTVAGGVAVAVAVVAYHSFRGWLAPHAPVLEKVTTTLAENRVTAAAYSPDGIALAWSELGGSLVVRRLESMSGRSFALPPEWNVESISWHSSGKRLLLSGYVLQPFKHDVRLLDLASGKLSLLKDDVSSAVYSPDGLSIAYTNTARTEGWVADSDSGKSRKVLAGSTTDTFPTLFWASATRLSYQRRRFAPKQGRLLDAEVAYEYIYGSIDAGSAQLLAEAPTPPMLGVCALEDGRVLFITRRSNLDLTDRNLWMMRTVPRTGQVKGKPRQLTKWDDADATALSCTRDGKLIGTTIQVNRLGVYIAE